MELLISLALLSTVMVIVTMSLDTSSRFNDRFSRQTDINNRANDVLNKLAMQLRMAAAGDPSAGSTIPTLDLPGPYLAGFEKDPSKAPSVRAYYFAVSTGNSGAPSWTEGYEPYKRMIIHDYSVTPGRLLLQPRDNLGNLGALQILTEDVAENGFSLTRVGNTLQMSLTLRSQTRVQEEIIYTALAQTLFLRSTLNQSSGNSVLTYVDNPEDADGNPTSTTTSAPTVMFGNLVTIVNSTDRQIALFFTAPIGKKIDPRSIVVSLGFSDDPALSIVDEGATVTIGGTTVTRRTYPPVAQWPSRNGTYSVTLTGSIPSNLTVNAVVANTDREPSEARKQYQ